MSTIHRHHESSHDSGQRDNLESMTPREQLLGLLVVILVLLVAILLRFL